MSSCERLWAFLQGGGRPGRRSGLLEEGLNYLSKDKGLFTVKQRAQKELHLNHFCYTSAIVKELPLLGNNLNKSFLCKSFCHVKI